MRLSIFLSFVCLALFGAVPSQAATTYLDYVGEELVGTVPGSSAELRIRSQGTGYFTSSVTDGDIELSDLGDFGFITHLAISIPIIDILDADTFSEFGLADLTNFHASVTEGQLVALSFDTRILTKLDYFFGYVSYSLHVSGLGPSETAIINPYDDRVIYGQMLPVVAAVPEPATWAMFITGFGLVGAAMRRRSRTSAATFARA